MENTHTVYFNMCHHYRKILSAKPRVDTSLPKTLRMKENSTSTRKLHREESFVRSRTSSQENLQPRAEIKNAITRQNNATVICPYYYQRHFKKEIENANKPYTSTILKNDCAQSKVRASRILCPPRKKRVQLAVSGKTHSCQKVKETRGKQNVNKTKITIDEGQVKSPKQISISSSVNSYSEESSEDSAYNEGECNTDSRGSTPQNALNKHESTKQRSIINGKSIAQNLPQSTRTKMEDVVCIQFLTDITNDILRKNIYTNTALRCVLQQHVKLNKYDLQMETMLTEITKLQERLGIPKEEKLDDEDFGLGGLNLNDDLKKISYEVELVGSSSTISTALPPTIALPKSGNDLTIGRDTSSTIPTLPKIGNDLVPNDIASSNDARIDDDDDENEEQNADYSDNFSEENSYSTRSSRSERQRDDRASNNRSSVKINANDDDDDDEEPSEIEEDVQEVDNKSEKYSDIGDESVSHLESDSEISEIC